METQTILKQQFKTMELFSGTQSFSKVMREAGHSTYCIDHDEQFGNDCTLDIMQLNELPNDLNMLWASPPCTAFSVASIGRHWQGGYRAYEPKTEFAKLSLALVEHTIRLISIYKPKLWYIENPRGVLRKLINPIFQKYGLTPIRHTVTYCQYGDTRMKPTDIWTNDINWKPRPICSNGANCHESAPRGSKTGTQGLKNAKFRSVIPGSIFKEILDHQSKEE